MDERYVHLFQQACAERDAYRQRVADLEAALKPFAESTGSIVPIVFRNEYDRAREVLYTAIREPVLTADPVAFVCVPSTEPPVDSARVFEEFLAECPCQCVACQRVRVLEMLSRGEG